jgi:hypothetical protein
MPTIWLTRVFRKFSACRLFLVHESCRPPAEGFVHHPNPCRIPPTITTVSSLTRDNEELSPIPNCRMIPQTKDLKADEMAQPKKLQVETTQDHLEEHSSLNNIKTQQKLMTFYYNLSSQNRLSLLVFKVLFGCYA